MENIDTIIAKNIAHCKGDVHCENGSLELGIKDSLTIAKDNLEAYNVKDSHLDITMSFILAVNIILALSLGYRGFHKSILYVFTSVFVIYFTGVSVISENYIYALISLGIAVVGVTIATTVGAIRK